MSSRGGRGGEHGSHGDPFPSRPRHARLPVSYPTLDAYGWSPRWEALLADVAPDAPGLSGGPSVTDAPVASDAAATSASKEPPEAGSGGASGGSRRAVPAPGRIVRHDGVAVAVALPDGIEMRPMRRGLDPAPVVGDWVVERGGTLEAVLPRASLLERKAVRREQPQALAANVDVVLVVCGLDRPVRAGRIRRTATLAWEAGAVPSVVLTKADALADDEVTAIADAVIAENPGLDVLVTSSRTGAGLDRLRAEVSGRTVVVVGESGAGKSSLVNLLLDDPSAAAVARVRTGDAKGRHTTTSRQLHVVPGGGVVIDTPGIREVGLWADTDAVAATFDDIDTLATGCRFADCRHDTEPGCAVRAAVESGDLAEERLESWRTLEREAASAERRADPRAQRAWAKSMGRIGREAMRMKDRDD